MSKICSSNFAGELIPMQTLFDAYPYSMQANSKERRHLIGCLIKSEVSAIIKTLTKCRTVLHSSDDAGESSRWSCHGDYLGRSLFKMTHNALLEDVEKYTANENSKKSLSGCDWQLKLKIVVGETGDIVPTQNTGATLLGARLNSGLYITHASMV